MGKKLGIQLRLGGAGNPGLVLLEARPSGGIQHPVKAPIGK